MVNVPDSALCTSAFCSLRPMLPPENAPGLRSRVVCRMWFRMLRPRLFFVAALSSRSRNTS